MIFCKGKENISILLIEIYSEGRARGDHIIKRIEQLDVAKGIGILLVVWAHAEGPFSKWIVQFHMPMFFLISGYLFDFKSTIKEFVKKKIYSLYIPFIFWNTLLWTLKTIFLIRVTFAQYIKKIMLILITIDKEGDFLGATWFLGALFVISILYKVISTCVKKPEVVLCIFVLFAIVGYQVNLPYKLSRTLILGMFFAMGIEIKIYNEVLRKYNDIKIAIFALILFGIIGSYNTVLMGKNEYNSFLGFVIGACLASYSVIGISSYIACKDNILKTVFAHLGKYSIDIVIWHFVFFRVGILIQLSVEGISIKRLLEYYPIYSKDGWLLYIIIGICMPLMWGRLLRNGKLGVVLKRVHVM